MSKIGTEFLVNTNTADNQYGSIVTTLTDGRFVITWVDSSKTLGDSDDSSIKAQIFDAAGVKVGTEFLVNTQTESSQVQPHVGRLANGGFVITWNTFAAGLGDSDYSVRAQIFSAAGAKVGTEFLVNTQKVSYQYSPTVAGLNNGDFVITWYDTSPIGDGSGNSIKAQRYTAAGAPIGTEFLVNTQTASNQYEPHITALANGGFVITWFDTSGTLGDSDVSIKAQVFSAAGAKVGTEFLVNTQTAGNQFNAEISALTNGGFVITWYDSNPIGDGDGASVKAQVFAADGTKVGTEVLVNTQTVDDQYGTTVAGLANGGFVIAWYDTNSIGDGSGYSVKAQVFNPAGVKVGTEFLVNTQTQGDQFRPDIAGLINDGFVITWYDNDPIGDGSDSSVKAQIFQNHAPVAANGIGSAREGSIITGTVSASDSDLDALTYVLVSNATHGSVTFNANGGYSYTPNTGYFGNDSFTFKASDGQVDSNIATLSLRQTPPPFQHSGTGHPGPHGGAYATPGVSDGFVVAITGDFNGDGTADVLWRDASGRVDNWSMQNESWAKSFYLGSHGADWQAAAAGDFNGDGTADILWRNSNTGQLDAWIMNNGQWSKSVDLGNHGTDWKVLGTGDFNGDGTDDILFQNTKTGATDAWQMSGGNWGKSLGFGTHNPAYSQVGIGDLDGDGTSDVLWRNPTTGATDQWHLKNGNWAGSIDLGSFSTAFELVGVKDFNGNGTADVLWRNPTTNQLEGWVIDDGNWFASVSLGAFDPAYSLGGTGDFNHSGTADVFWHNTKTGETSTWLFSA